MSRFEWKWKSLEMSQEDKCTETLEGDKIGCIYSVMIKMATTTNVQETTEDRRRQNYRKSNPKSVQLSNLKFSAKVSRRRQVDSDFDSEFKLRRLRGKGDTGLKGLLHFFPSSWWKFVQAGSHQARKISSKTRPQWSHPRAWWFGWFGWIK